ncbi:type III restriction-modification system endonuclease [Oligosphaera ethanolica]|uniref:Type III restriction enzyme n=1 Tax=Oligosphaera ethanolica TaxID=760260 RepID=A0AAE4ARW7_9BACT|nr:DEAD/DEAH box helicase family protein [Oligosphaera ethanolica]MDQ0291897.1 type III restriction enzyme [Oligosphaera ethanolica]
MKFKFKVQQFQSDAVDSTIAVFAGQKKRERLAFLRDQGRNVSPVLLKTQDSDSDDDLSLGYRNHDIELSDSDLLRNIHDVQTRNNIMLSPCLVEHIGRCSLDIEMETGTGKTYVYIKTMFEMNKHYGWSKFIVVVPSVAIREGVKKSFEMTQEHFMEHYGKKARFFIYDSDNLNQLDDFSSSSGINVMIINIQAFNRTLKEGQRNKESKRIYMPQDAFGSRRPIDVIKANRPIVILDEPQKMGGDATQTSLKYFNPLFCLNYSATHKDMHNPIYVLDALDAFNKRLVKKIEVKGFEVKNFRGTDGYLYLENIVVSPQQPPKARLEFEIAYDKSINREIRKLGVGDNLYHLSNRMEQYKNGYTVTEINPLFGGKITFQNGEELTPGQVIGDISERDLRRIQIRETIISHFDKEEKLFNQGIKTLSLFFIDEVAKYRQYDADGNELLGEYGQMFEQEYQSILNDRASIFPSAYQDYLRNISTSITHNGYFSIDKTGRAINSEAKRGTDFSDDITAYDLILKRKEVLLDLKEPTRFIFSHSALREGWDNPNVFQICTLKHSDSSTQKRQEVGRGLRLCVNSDGTRMDADVCGIDQVQELNKLTVIASESYAQFVTDLQKTIKEVLYDRPTKASEDYFVNKPVIVDGQRVMITAEQAHDIYRYLVKNDYVDRHDKVSEKYRADLANNTLEPLPEEIQNLASGVHTLIQSVYDESVLANMVSNGKETQVEDNGLNDNFYREEFQKLWSYINHKYAYTVSFDSRELIDKAVAHINKELFVSQLKYTVVVGEQHAIMDANAVKSGESFSAAKSNDKELSHAESSHVKYDLIGKIAEATVMTRRTIAEILHGMAADKFVLFQANPEEFISKVSKLIKEQKATQIVDCISYNQIEGSYDSDIFTAGTSDRKFDQAFRANKSIQEFVFTDGSAEQSVERKFVQDLETASEVCVYAKLPKGFAIPTPVGNYSPDWAIAFNAGTVKHIFFVAETKGTMETLQLRPIEKAKISCARRLFNELSTSKVKYHDVDSYQTLLDIMNKL